MTDSKAGTSLCVMFKLPTTYTASKATDLYSPVPSIFVARSYFEVIASMVSILFMIAMITIPFVVWFLSRPVVSYEHLPSVKASSVYPQAL